MVKTAFLDKEITNKIQLTSANSINIARWLPQMFYFAFAYKQLKNKQKEIVIFYTKRKLWQYLCRNDG